MSVLKAPENPVFFFIVNSLVHIEELYKLCVVIIITMESDHYRSHYAHQAALLGYKVFNIYPPNQS